MQAESLEYKVSNTNWPKCC